MRIVITGNLGYVGPIVLRHLGRAIPGAELVGYDSGYFAHCLTGAGVHPEHGLLAQFYGDVRDIGESGVFRDADVVIQLAAISNDPMGNRFESVTREINHEAVVQVAREAKKAGVRSCVFASSCSIYGAASDGPRSESDELNPQTAYARSKIEAERGLQSLADEDFMVTCLRFATACGMSSRLRLDLVLNDFVASARVTGRIVVLSDGSPWRPLIDVEDMARAVEWAIRRTGDEYFLCVNAGCDGWNFQVRDLAQAVAAEIPGTEICINANAAPDRRSYRVDFRRFREMAPAFQPKMSLSGTIRGLVSGLCAMGHADQDFRQSSLVRLHVLQDHLREGRLGDDLRWLPE